MASPLIVRFPGTAQISCSEVGSKAASLMRLSEAGLPVPSGAVLTTRFFDPWVDSITTSTSWSRLTDASPEGWPPLCDVLKERARVLPLAASQRDALAMLRGDLAASGVEVRFAVRSSSPDKDKATASFAGGYATRLGVAPDDLEDAVRHCFSLNAARCRRSF